MAVVKTGVGGGDARGVGRYLGWSEILTVDTSSPADDPSEIKLVHSGKMDSIKIINCLNLLVNKSNNRDPNVVKLLLILNHS